VISTLCSYEVERHISSSFGLKSLDQIKPILKFSLSKNRLTGMSNFTLMYPCMTLATKIDPLMPKLMTADKMPYKSQITKEIKKQIKSFIKPITKKYSKLDGQYDQRWYWAALVLLDKHYYSKPLNEWFENTSEENSWKQMLQSKEDANTNSKFASHVDELFKCFQGNLDLGPPPRDLADVLTKIALASPAVVGLRSLMRVCNTDKTGTLLSGAAKMALGFRYLFNLPSSISIIRSLKNKDNSHYWINVLDYCIDGNLQSVIDEYLHILQESLGIINKSDDGAINEITNEVYDAMTIRTVNLKFDDIVVQPRKKVISQNKKDTEMRCRFALRFGDSKNDEDKEKTRSDQVRKAFNSPFSPFILASTSIGQEGLDFHQYCHEIYHWNLPSNPVDLEQREGRINRYKGHAIRKNVAKKYTFAPLNGKTDSLIDPWKYLFSCAVEDRDPKHNDLVPYWVFELEEGGYRINRHIPVLPFSREKQKQDDLRNSLVAYRMVFGQPRQEDLVNYLNSRFDSDLKRDELLKYKIDLSPNV
jgi:Helicase conserved C-terminal domain